MIRNLVAAEGVKMCQTLCPMTSVLSEPDVATSDVSKSAPSPFFLSLIPQNRQKNVARAKVTSRQFSILLSRPGCELCGTSFHRQRLSSPLLKVDFKVTTVWFMPSVTMFCVELFQKFRLGIVLHSNCNKSPTAGWTFQKCSKCKIWRLRGWHCSISALLRSVEQILCIQHHLHWSYQYTFTFDLAILFRWYYYRYQSNFILLLSRWEQKRYIYH